MHLAKNASLHLKQEWTQLDEGAVNGCNPSVIKEHSGAFAQSPPSDIYIIEN
jgi:hypothetical protein